MDMEQYPGASAEDVIYQTPSDLAAHDFQSQTGPPCCRCAPLSRDQTEDGGHHQLQPREVPGETRDSNTVSRVIAM